MFPLVITKEHWACHSMVNVCARTHSFFLSRLMKWYSLHEVNYVPVWFQLKLMFSVFCFYFYFLFQPYYLTKSTVNSAFMHCLRTHKFYFSVTFSLKMGLMTIHTFKNYFAIVFSVSVFSFNKNKLNLNGPIVSEAFPFIHKTTLLFYSKYYYINIYIYIYMESWNL